MIDRNGFKNLIFEHVFFKTPISDEKMDKFYDDFDKNRNHSISTVIDFFKTDGYDVSKYFTNNEFALSSIDDALKDYILDLYNNKILHIDGFCLKKKLLNKACCLKYDENILGVVKDFDETNSRYLIVDFGGEKEMKIDFEELIIVGQNK